MTQHPSNDQTALLMDDRQQATILAALRYYQHFLYQNEPGVPGLRDIATNGGVLQPLTTAEIEILCDEVNFGSETKRVQHALDWKDPHKATFLHLVTAITAVGWLPAHLKGVAKPLSNWLNPAALYQRCTNEAFPEITFVRRSPSDQLERGTWMLFGRGNGQGINTVVGAIAFKEATAQALATLPEV